MRTLAILGNGPEAAFAATVLASNLSGIFDIRWHRGDNGTNRENEVVRTNTSIRNLLHSIGLPERELLAKGATPLLGTAVAMPDRAPLFLGHADLPRSIGGIPFYQALLWARGADAPPAPQHYNVAALLAGQNRFAPPSGDPTSIDGMFSYGLAMPATAWIDVFAERAASLGVTDGDEDAGDADIVIDTRPASDENDWKEFCGTAVTVAWSDEEATPPVPYIFCKVDAETLETIHRLPAKTVRRTTSIAKEGRKFGRKEKLWDGNSIAMGPAASFLPGLLPNDFQLLVRQLTRFIDFAPSTSDGAEEAKEYNRRIGEDIDRAFDSEAPLLGEAFSPVISDELARKTELFTYSGRLSFEEGEVLNEHEWFTLMDFVHGSPERGDLRAQRLPKAKLADVLRQLRGDIAAAAAGIPPLEQSLEKLKA